MIEMIKPNGAKVQVSRSELDLYLERGYTPDMDSPHNQAVDPAKPKKAKAVPADYKAEGEKIKLSDLEDYAEIIAPIVLAIGKMDKKDFSKKTGKPSVYILESLLGHDITAAMRDDAFKKYRGSNGS